MIRKLLAFIAVLFFASFGFTQSTLDQIESRPSADNALMFHYPEAATKAAEDLMDTAPADLEKLKTSLGVQEMKPIQVWVLRRVGDYFRLHNIPNNAPEWAAGLSFSNRATVIVANKPGAQGMAEVDATFRHELAHVAVDIASNGKKVPRWFHEGFAVLHADEWTADRSELLSRAAAASGLIAFGDLEYSFPDHHNTASLAYAQSFHFVRDLKERHGEDVFARLFENMANGDNFHQSFRKVTGESVPVAEGRWRQDLKNASSLWSLFMDGIVIFFGASLLFLVAWRLRKKRTARKLASMKDNPAWDYDESRYPLPGDH